MSRYRLLKKYFSCIFPPKFVMTVFSVIAGSNQFSPPFYNSQTTHPMKKMTPGGGSNGQVKKLIIVSWPVLFFIFFFIILSKCDVSLFNYRFTSPMSLSIVNRTVCRVHLLMQDTHLVSPKVSTSSVLTFFLQ